MKIAKFRVARPTRDLQALRRFYVDDLGLLDKGAFESHAGYDGFLVGTADASYEIEFTHHPDVAVIDPPTGDHLLVFYLESDVALATLAARLKHRGHTPVAPLNPYWTGKSLTYADPDGWRVVLFDQTKLSSAT